MDDTFFMPSAEIPQSSLLYNMEESYASPHTNQAQVQYPPHWSYQSPSAVGSSQPRMLHAIPPYIPPSRNPVPNTQQMPMQSIQSTIPSPHRKQQRRKTSEKRIYYLRAIREAVVLTGVDGRKHDKIHEAVKHVTQAVGIADTLVNRERVKGDIGECLDNRKTYANRKRKRRIIVEEVEEHQAAGEDRQPGGGEEVHASDETDDQQVSGEEQQSSEDEEGHASEETEDQQVRVVVEEHQSSEDEEGQSSEVTVDQPVSEEEDQVSEGEGEAAPKTSSRNSRKMPRYSKGWKGWVIGEAEATKAFQPVDGRRRPKHNPRYL